MNVYVESGFVLTLALQQDDHPAADRLLQLARNSTITLKIPAFSLSEPFARLKYWANNRHRLVDELSKEIRELGRTQPHQSMASELSRYAIQMASVLQTQMDAVEAIVVDIGHSCEIIQINDAILTSASSFKTEDDMSPQDAIILASVISDPKRPDAPLESLFISQNVKDFEPPLIQDEFRRLNCKYLADFPNAVRFIERPTIEPAE